MIINTSRLIGKPIIGAQARVLGEVESVKMDSETWKITHLGVCLSDDATTEFGFKKPFWSCVVISLPVSAVSVVGDVISLDKSIKNLHDIIERLDKK